jgi:predicted nucleic acid-binding protein
MIVDSNIFLDIFSPESEQSLKVRNALEALSLDVPPCINAIVFAEISPGFEDCGLLEGLLEGFNVKFIGLNAADAFRAGQAFRSYRRNGGPRTSLIPDFLIGAQAAVRGWPILTRDPKRFASYFPEVELIDPLQVSND